MQQAILFKVADRVRHDKRPEWGIGLVQRTEHQTIGDKHSQRLTIRFPNAGLKTLSTIGAPLTIVTAPAGESPDEASGTFVDREQDSESGWLGAISKVRPEDAMMELPTEATDPFANPRARLQATLDLYRFEPVGRSLVDWAVARSGLDDPLSRFTRHELEAYFQRWGVLRDRHLSRLLKDARHDTGLLQSLLASASPAARRAVARCNAER